MTNQTDGRHDSEGYFDFLNNGGYLLFDYQRDSENLGTYCNVKLSYQDEVPWQGLKANNITVKELKFSEYARYSYQ
jgi:hypothetical protein